MAANAKGAKHIKAEMTHIVQVSFPSAQEVYLMGEFNNWSTTATPLVLLGNGIWEAKLSVTHMLRRLSFFVLEQGQRLGRVVEAEAKISLSSS